MMRPGRLRLGSRRATWCPYPKRDALLADHDEKASEAAGDQVHDQLILVGSDADWDAAVQLVRGASAASYYSVEAALRACGRPIPYDAVIDVSADNRPIERIAWNQATDLVETLATHGDYYVAPALEAMRRGLFSGTFKPIEMARARARYAQGIARNARSIRTVGVSSIDAIALREALGDSVAVSGVAHGQRAEPVQAGRAETPSRRSLVRRVVTLAGLFRGSLAHRIRFWRLLRPMRAFRSSAARPCGLVLVRSDQHAMALHSTIGELRLRGWKFVLAIPAANFTLSEEVLETFDDTVHVATFAKEDPLRRKLDSGRRDAMGGRNLIIEWGRSAGLDAYADSIADTVERSHASARRRIASLEHVMGALRPRVVLSVDETSALVEAAAVVALSRGIPCVNVQHGIISDTLLRADFRFDAFCVFGEAYAEMLHSLGTDRERIRVVGNPFLELQKTNGVTDHRPNGPSAASEVQGPTVLFAAQYSNRNFSDITMHAALSLVLEWTELHAGSQVIVRLHPLGEGRELGYELALEEHPAANVNVTREGDLFNMIKAADCVATYSSTVALDAIAVLKPVVIIDPCMDSAMRGLAEEGVALWAGTVEELGDCVRRVQTGDVLSDQKVASFNERYGSVAHGSAGSRIADICEEFGRAKGSRLRRFG